MRIKMTVLATVFASSCYALQQNGWNYEKCDGGVKIGGRLISVDSSLRLRHTSGLVDDTQYLTSAIEIPETFDGLPLVEIGALSFRGASAYVIPGTVTKISPAAFSASSAGYLNDSSVTGCYKGQSVYRGSVTGYTPCRILTLQPSTHMNVFFRGDRPIIPTYSFLECERNDSNEVYALRTISYYDGGLYNEAGVFYLCNCWVVEGTSGWVTNSVFHGGLVNYYAAKAEISPTKRRFVWACNVSLSCVNDTATLYYTIDGSEPVTNETVNCFRYTTPFVITENTVVKALAHVASYSSTVTYVQHYVKATATPVVSSQITSPFYQTGNEVVLSCATPGAIIRYTTDGSEATSESAIYEAPFSISETTTIRARAFCDGIEDSDEMNVTFTREWYTVDVPLIEPSGAEFENVSQTVSLSCATDGATMLYTTDGSDPKVNGREYTKPFAIYKSCTVRAIAVKYDWKDSADATATFTRGETLSEAANLYGDTMETDTAAPWTVDAAVSHDGVSSVRSGAIGNNGTTYLMASVKKAGTVSFWWKAQCEEPDEEDGEDGYYDYGAFLVDDVVKARIAGNDTGWQFVSVEVPTGGKHVLRWEYRKDGATSYAPDCIWVDQVQWSPADGSGYTLTSPEPVPYSWLSQYGLGVASGDFETAANAANGKTIWGRPMSVWQDYVAGTVPTNLESTLKARIEMQGATPLVTWDPNLNEDGVERRLYKVYGSETLENGGEWQYPTNSLHRFFKVTVEMP